MYLVDYHTHPYGHGEDIFKPAHNLELLKKYISKAEKMEIKELGFSDHSFLLADFNWDNLLEIREEKNIKIRLGIEFDYSPEKEQDIKTVLERLPLDYIIGSVHHIGDWGFDHPDYIAEYNKRDLVKVYQDYFKLVKKTIELDVFDIIAHLDLIKVFKFIPEGIDLLQLVEPCLQAIKTKQKVLEINTNGLNKPIKEIYPSLNIINRAYQLDIPVTLASDAHVPNRVGEGIKEAIELIKELGYTKIATFRKRKMKLIDI